MCPKAEHHWESVGLKWEKEVVSSLLTEIMYEYKIKSTKNKEVIWSYNSIRKWHSVRTVHKRCSHNKE